MTAAVLSAFAAFAVLSVLLAIVDVRSLRLPDVLVLPAYGLAGVLVVSALSAGDGERAGRIVAGSLLFFACGLALHLTRPDGLGGGDVKVLGAIGAFTAWHGMDAIVLAASAMALLGCAAAASVVFAARGAAPGAAPFPLGPVLLTGGWWGIVVSAG